MSYEGAMLGGYLLPHDEFVQVMTELLVQNNAIIIQQLTEINKIIDYQSTVKNRDIKRAYELWDQFQTQTLQNPTTKLLAITNFYNHSSAPQTWIYADEANALQKSGKINLTLLNNIKSGLRQMYCSQVLAAHLSDMFRSINKILLNKEERLEIYTIPGYSEVRSRLNAGKISHSNQYFYGNIIYGKEGIAKRGKIADAYLSHLGKLHRSIFASNDDAILQNLDNEISESGGHGVREEEMAHAKLGFLHLLLESLNNIAWYTGGDLIVTDSAGQVVANIQLKTSANEGAAVGQISTVNLSKALTTILALFQNAEGDYTNVAEEFYKMLKTSSVAENLGDAAREAAVENARERLHLTK